MKFKKLVSLVFLFLNMIVFSKDTPSCKLCNAFQNSILDYTSANSDKILGLLAEFCNLGGTGGLCEYFVKNFGEQIFAHKFDFLKQTQYYCTNILGDCDDKFKKFDLDKFKQKIDSKFPKTNFHFSFKNSFPNEESSKFKVLVMNDIHYQDDYLYKSNIFCKDPGGCCAEIHGMPSDPKSQAGYWGTPDAACDIPGYTYEKTLEYIRQNVEKPDFIVILGDNVGHHYFRKPAETVANATAFVLSRLKKVFPDVKVIPVLGNHECHPVEYLNFTDYKNFVYEKIISQFELFITKYEINEFKEKGYFTIEENDKNVKFISINSQVLDGFNTFLMDVTNYAWDFLEFLAQELYNSEIKKQKVIILNHIEITDYFAIRELNVALLYILERFQDTVISYLSGHVHRDQIRFMHDSNKRVFGANYISPSITPSSCHDPSFRIYEYEDGSLLDYTQYSFDIEKHNILAEKDDFSFNFKIKYRFLEYYGLKNTGKEELQRFQDRFEARDEKLIEKYVNNYYCVDKLKDYSATKEMVLCELGDNIDLMYHCLFQNTMSGTIENLPGWIFQKLLLNKARLPKNDSVSLPGFKEVEKSN